MVLWKDGAGGDHTVEVRCGGGERSYSFASGEARFVEIDDLQAVTDDLMARFPDGSLSTPAALQ